MISVMLSVMYGRARRRSKGALFLANVTSIQYSSFSDEVTYK